MTPHQFQQLIVTLSHPRYVTQLMSNLASHAIRNFNLVRNGNLIYFYSRDSRVDNNELNLAILRSVNNTTVDGTDSG